MPQLLSVKEVKRLGNSSIISEQDVYRYVYKSLPMKKRMMREVNEGFVREYTVNLELLYHPFWVAESLVVADRPPFQPKKTPNIIFVDAVSGYRGVFSKVPSIESIEIDPAHLVKKNIKTQTESKKYIKDVQEKQINRAYILKKPKHEVEHIYESYLPIWKVTIESDLIDDTFYINGNTGELEQHMSKRWNDSQDIL
ncbi:hypothetical protein [Tenuibacillus multivorans]|uniref:Uncharacterized protein n=1 Tax=Tenuibacillus multivorans TaxID=237069 RepID=A0A1H0AJJ2_9BACI|nr:hypothetical protein [Tenuibacillus multivorans]GEL78177.1 hypothetical protein TMU01_24120 [Tenuibacillus multivorans]SDN33752.1 hypothetical protein SAMN05216498_1969 [Tenuibacillus multivorans]